MEPWIAAALILGLIVFVVVRIRRSGKSRSGGSGVGGPQSGGGPTRNL